MNTKTLSLRALSVIDQYKNFAVGKAVCNVPYFNNKTTRARGALRAYVGKGSPKDIYEEVTASLNKEHVAIDILTGESLKKYLTDKNIGIDCSGLAYYILNAESEERGEGSLDKNIHFVNTHGLFGKVRSLLRPVENCNVSTLANDKNSSIVKLKDIQPGDMITMLSKTNERDHILVVSAVDFQNSLPQKIYYAHANAYPEDGVYGTGLRQGYIDIINLGSDKNLENTNILECAWSEINLHSKMSGYDVLIRRLNWL